LKSIIALSVLLLFSPALAAAEPYARFPDHLRLGGTETLRVDEGAAPVASESAPLRNCLFCADYPKLFVRDVKHVFTAPLRWNRRDWLLAGAAGGAIVWTGVFYDRKIETAMQDHRSHTTNRIASAFEPFGAIYSAGILGGFYLAGAAFKWDEAEATGLDGLSATLIASGIIATGVKEVAGRSRPRDHEGTTHFSPFGGKHSFPSGHATQAFVTASVLSAHYPRWWVEVPAYGIATMVGFARIDHNAHFASDVLAGALLGASVGYSVVYFNDTQRAGGDSGIALAPLSDPEVPGVEVLLKF
jgi:membrane-associated phospholipid phosphatase